MKKKTFFVFICSLIFILFYFWLTQPGTVYKYCRGLGQTLGSFNIHEVERPEPTPISYDFNLIIPHLSLNAPILAEVDGTNSHEYLWKVKQGIGHFKHMEYGGILVDGSFPGEGGNIFLFGHSQIPGRDVSGYKGAFNGLESLLEGDKIVVFYQGQRFEYKVKKGLVVPKTALEYLEKTPEETLHLMTCWPLGLDIQRYLIIAQ